MAISSKAIMAVLALKGEERRIMAEALRDENITTAQGLAEMLEKKSVEDGHTAPAELSKLSPADKLEVAARLRREAFDALEDENDPGDGPTAAELAAVMNDLKALDSGSRGLIVRAIAMMEKEEAGKDGR